MIKVGGRGKRYVAVVGQLPEDPDRSFGWKRNERESEASVKSNSNSKL